MASEAPERCAKLEASQRALKFLKEAQTTLPPEDCEDFLGALTDYNHRLVSCKYVKDLALKVLFLHPGLAEDFAQFLPVAERESYRQHLQQEIDSSHTNKRKREGGDQAAGARCSGVQLYQLQLKRSLHASNLQNTWKEVCSRVERMVENIHADPNWIPSINFEDIAAGTVPAHLVDQLKITGCCKVRNTVPKETATGWNNHIMKELKYYLGLDPAAMWTYDAVYDPTSARAPEFGGVQEVFYSRAQFAAREHENMIKVRTWLNHMWKYQAKDTGEYTFLPDKEICFVDRLRHRMPGYSKQTGMKHHVDNGCLSRWADPAWQRIYSKIFEGKLDGYDPWDATHRTECAGGGFRSYQGWLALTPQGPNDGSLEVVPMLRETTMYILLRPLLADVPAHLFPGARDVAGDSVEVTSRWHSPLLRGVTSIGHVDPGDTVWWHPDLIHAVSSEHTGTQPANVIYVPASPMCPCNASYVARQRESFLKGEAPPDYPFGRSLALEVDSPYRARPSDLGKLGKQMMGIEPYTASDEDDEGSAAFLRECNAILF